MYDFSIPKAYWEQMKKRYEDTAKPCTPIHLTYTHLNKMMPYYIWSDERLIFIEYREIRFILN